jgi:hypothetical protein
MSNTIFAMTLTSVRAAIQSYLDDDGTRWSVGSFANVLDMSTDIDRAIKFGMFQAARFYIKAAGNSICISKEFTTDNNGQLSLGGGNTPPITAAQEDTPMHIAGLAIQDGNTWADARSTSWKDIEYGDVSPRTVRLYFIPEPYTDSSGVLRFVSDLQIEIPELEQLAIVYAVKNLLPRDAEQNMALNDAVFQAENSISAICETPLAIGFPHYGRSSSVYYQYRWSTTRYDAKTNQRNVIQITDPLLF